MLRLLYPVESEKAVTRDAGNSRVRRSTSAPLKSPDWSGVNVFDVVTDCSRFDGKRSSGTTRRSGSGLGMRAPLSDVVVYRSPSPRTTTYLPSCTVTPLTRCTACAASESGLFWICSAVIEFTTPDALRCMSSAAFTEPRSALAVTDTASSCTFAVASEMLCSSV